jgi:hypothetical protein
MSIVLELRGRYKHAGITLLHENSEDVVVANVFGIIKNLPHALVLWPWLSSLTAAPLSVDKPVSVRFWQSQSIPVGKEEGSTKVDVVIDGARVLVFIEAKLGADASRSTAHDEERDQLTRNLDVGHRLAAKTNRDFHLVYLTPDDSQPELVTQLRLKLLGSSFNTGESGVANISRLHWASWASVGDVIAERYVEAQFGPTDAAFALDVLAYLAKKGLWKSTLPDEEVFYSDTLLEPLRSSNSPFLVKYKRRGTRDQEWRSNVWTESELRDFLGNLKSERERALLKVIASHDGGVLQGRLLAQLPFLVDWKALQRLKSNVNGKCRGRDRASILSHGSGPSGAQKVHEFNPLLGDLRAIAIELSKAFEIRAHLL